jgi:hypothetical protein
VASASAELGSISTLVKALYQHPSLMDIVLLHTGLNEFLAPGLALLEDFDFDVVGECFGDLTF